MKGTKVVAVEALGEAALTAFLRESYGARRARFLAEHGTWWYRQTGARRAVVAEGRIAAYCATIPTTCLLNGRRTQADWAVDMVVAPGFRGRGLHGLLDQAQRQESDLLLCFPNRVAAGIIARHGWQVRRDVWTLLLPLSLDELRPLRHLRRETRVAAKAGLKCLAPASALWRSVLAHQSTGDCAVGDPEPAFLARAGSRLVRAGFATTWRNADYCAWRFTGAPYHAQLSYYIAGGVRDPSVVVVARQVGDGRSPVVRILDFFGDMTDVRGLRTALSGALRNAARLGACQVTVMTSLPLLIPVFRSLGFIFSRRSCFCWWSPLNDVVRAVGTSAMHWTLADSDNDEPV